MEKPSKIRGLRSAQLEESGCFRRMAKTDVIKKVTFGQRLKRGEGISSADT